MGTSERNSHKKKTAAFRDMTAAHVREMPDVEFAEVMFLESARIYRLSKNNPKYEEILKRLREAIAKEGVVRVLLDQPHGSIVQALEVDA